MKEPHLHERARDGLYDLMQYAYLWNNKMPTVKLSDYPGPKELLEAVRYKPIDVYSFVMTWDEFHGIYVREVFRVCMASL